MAHESVRSAQDFHGDLHTDAVAHPDPDWIDPKAGRARRGIAWTLIALAFLAFLASTPLSSGQAIREDLAQANYSVRATTIAEVYRGTRGAVREIETADGSRLSPYLPDCKWNDARDIGAPVTVTTMKGIDGSADVERLGTCSVESMALAMDSGASNPYVISRTPILLRPFALVASLALAGIGFFLIRNEPLFRRKLIREQEERQREAAAAS